MTSWHRSQPRGTNGARLRALQALLIPTCSSTKAGRRERASRTVTLSSSGSEKRRPRSPWSFPGCKQSDCALCEVLRDEALEIALGGDLSLRAASAGRVPYELLIAPRAHEADPREDDLASALALLRRAIIALREHEGPVPLNAWLHTGAHWHFEVVPRLTVFAGLELGAGLYVNWLPPEEAATRLR